MPTATPLADKIRVEILPQQERSSVLVTMSRETPLRRCKITALGPDACRRTPLEVGQLVLCNILAGQSFGDETILPAASVVALLDD